MSPRKNDKEPEQASIKDSWEFKTGKFILRIVAALFFISYLLMTVPHAAAWAWQSYYRQQPMSAMQGYLEKAVKGDGADLLKWIRARQPSERPEILAQLEPHTGKLPSMFFMTFARWAAEEDNVDKAVFWHFFARYRLRYDALRCGAPDSVENMDGLLSLIPEGQITPTIARKSKTLLAENLQEVLDFDAKYPAENSPKDICDLIFKIEGAKFLLVAPRHWNVIRHDLRRITEQGIQQINETTGTPKTPAPQQESAPVPDSHTETHKPE